MATLYEIDSNIREIIDRIYADELFDDGEITDADFTALEQLQADRKVKLENIALYIKNCEADALAIKAEEDALEKRRKRLERKAEGLKGLILRSMLATGDKELSSARFCAKIRSSKATQIIDETLIPKEYMVVKTSEQPDKTAIKKAIEAGIDVAGAQVVVNQKVNIS